MKCKILGVRGDRPGINGSGSRDDPVAVVAGTGVQFTKRAGIEKLVEPVAGGEAGRQGWSVLRRAIQSGVTVFSFATASERGTGTTCVPRSAAIRPNCPAAT